MTEWFGAPRGNPSSIHRFGREANAAVAEARAEVGALIGAPPEAVVFTSGGTEGDVWALRGIFDLPGPRAALVVSAVEHPAVLETARGLQAELRVVPVDERGRLAELNLDEQTRLVSVMAANNETGVLFDVAAVAREAHAAGALVHTDAVQAAGKIPIDVAAWDVDLCTISAHKIGGPSGIGAVFVRPGTKIAPLLFGGGQEKGLRSGTYNTMGIVGFGAAAGAARLALADFSARVAALRDRLEAAVLGAVAGARVLGREEQRLPNTASFAFPGLKGEALVMELDAAGIAVSTGAACSSGSGKGSHVLVAMGLPRAELDGAVRVSLGPETTRADVETGAEAIVRAANRLLALGR